MMPPTTDEGGKKVAEKRKREKEPESKEEGEEENQVEEKEESEEEEEVAPASDSEEDREPEPVPASSSTAAGEEGASKDAKVEADIQEVLNEDPYLLADATYIEKDTRWRNKQRTLVFCSRGIDGRSRHLMEDMKKLMPHHKAEPKFEKKQDFNEIPEICELKSCNNCLYFECRKHKDLYMYLGRVPSGPTCKFRVMNVHTLGEIHLAGNCLLYSRPLLSFDAPFDELPHLRLIKDLFIQAVGTARNHPRSKPFFDHVISLFYSDKKIWFRHYQISPQTDEAANDPEGQVLTEIGPRFVLDPIKIFAGSFGGPTLWSNSSYMSPTMMRRRKKAAQSGKYAARVTSKEAHAEREANTDLGPDELDSVFE